MDPAPCKSQLARTPSKEEDGKDVLWAVETKHDGVVHCILPFQWKTGLCKG